MAIIPIFFAGAFGILFLTSFSQTMKKVNKNTDVLAKNMQGDAFYGFTPDWVHFFKASEWAAKNIPAGDVIGSRKPSMSFIYGGGREFFGIYKVPMMNIDTLRLALEGFKGECFAVDYFELEKKGFSGGAFDKCRPYNCGMLANDKHFYLIYRPTADKKEVLLSLFRDKNVETLTNLDDLWARIKASGESYYAEDADFMLNFLKKNKVKYLVLGSLRVAPAQNTGQIINTVHKMVYFVQMKYPNAFRTIYQIGEEEDEPAQVMEIAQ